MAILHYAAFSIIDLYNYETLYLLILEPAWLSQIFSTLVSLFQFRWYRNCLHDEAESYCIVVGCVFGRLGNYLKKFHTDFYHCDMLCIKYNSETHEGSFEYIKAGVNVNLNEFLRSLKKGLKKNKNKSWLGTPPDWLLFCSIYMQWT